MKKQIVITGLCIAIFQLASCTKKAAPASSETPAEEVASLKSKYTEPQILQGKTVYTNNCGKCHELHKPEEYTIKRWHKILPDMCRKAKLGNDDAALVRAWVITNAKLG